MIVGVSIYSFESIGIIFSVRGTVKESNDFRYVFRTVSWVVTILYIGFSVFGVMS